MARLLRFALLATVFAAITAPQANAVRLVLPESLQTARFKIHFAGDPPSPATAVTRQQIGQLAGNLERAYTQITSEWGFPAPLDDGDGRIDVYVTDLGPIGALGLAFPDTALNQTSGYVHIDDDATELSYLSTHELFHLVQFGMWSPMEGWLAESTAEWAGFRYLGFPTMFPDEDGADLPIRAMLGMPDMSLDCAGDGCGLDEYEDGGYSRWHFFQYVHERYGTPVIKDVFERAKTANDPAIPNVTFLEQAVQAKGKTLGDVFTDWHVANMGGDYTATGLKNIVPPVHSTTQTGLTTGQLPTQAVTVNHLAARYLSFRRGDGTGDELCFAATLNVFVTIPTGVTSRPYFWWTAEGSKPTPLALYGNTASLNIPWDTCTWPSTAGILSLPNSTTNVDGAAFTVTATLSVDPLTIANPTAPPAGPYTGPTVSAPAAEEAPSIALYGPELLRVSRKTRVLRLVVFSSGIGKLQAKLGTAQLGTRALRAGNNDLRFTLPRTALRTLNARGTLTLTSLSPSGTVGATVKRNVTLTK